MENPFDPQLTVDMRPKKVEDDTEQRCKNALERLGATALLPTLKPNEREELASLDRAYPEGAMFKLAAEHAMKSIRKRQQSR